MLKMVHLKAITNAGPPYFLGICELPSKSSNNFTLKINTKILLSNLEL